MRLDLRPLPATSAHPQLGTDETCRRREDGRYGKIVLTMGCDNACFFCYDQIERRSYRTLTEEETRVRIDLAALAGVEVLTFIGGEVTRLPWFLRAVAYARGRFRDIHVNTHGRTFKDEAYCRAALAAGLTQIDVSLHGATAALHDRMVGAPGAFDELVRGLRHLTALRDRDGTRLDLSATSIVARQNHEDLPRIGALLDALGLHSYRVKYAFEPDHVDAALAAERFVPRFSEAMPGVRLLLAEYGERLNVQTHDIPFCQLGEYVTHSSDAHQIDVDIYGREGTVRAPRFSRRFARSPVCHECAFQEECCQPVGRYVAVFGDAELTPYDEAAARPLRERLRRDRELRALRDGLEPLCRARRFREALARCAELDARAPGHPVARQVRSRCEVALLRAGAAACHARGDRAGYQALRRRLWQQYGHR